MARKVPVPYNKNITITQKYFGVFVVRLLASQHLEFEQKIPYELEGDLERILMLKKMQVMSQKP